MIEEKEFAKKLYRIRQDFDTRVNDYRLEMNERVPGVRQEIYDEIMKNFSLYKASAYPEVNMAYNAMAKYLNQAREKILLTNGSDSGISLIFKTFCTEGDIIATCGPTFAMYKVHAELLKCEYKEFSSDETGAFNLKNVLNDLNKIKDQTRLFVIANPNGVTGFAFDKEEIKEILEFTSKNNIVVLIDEAYADFDKIDMSEFVDKFDNLIIVRSFSKSYGLAGLRIGYIYSSEYLIRMIEKFKPMMEVNFLAVEAIKVVCSDKKYLNDSVKEIVEARKYFKDELIKMNYDVIERHGNFLLIDFKENREKVENIMKNNRIRYRTFNDMLKKYIRISIGTMEVMKEVVEIIKNA